MHVGRIISFSSKFKTAYETILFLKIFLIKVTINRLQIRLEPEKILIIKKMIFSCLMQNIKIN